MYLDLKDKGLARDLLIYGKREEFSTEVMRRELHPGQVIVDIGANIGYYALLEAKMVGGKGRVYCLEPAPDNVELLKRNIAANGYRNVEVVHAAAGAESAMGTIYLSDRHNQHALIEGSVANMVNSAPVRIISLDDFLSDKPHPSLIRMDVEGFELDIVRGMKKTLSKKKPLKLYIEVHGFFLKDKVRDLFALLKTNGFRIKAAVWDPMEVGGALLRPLFYYCSRKLGIGDVGLFHPTMEELEKIFIDRKEVTLAVFFERT